MRRFFTASLLLCLLSGYSLLVSAVPAKPGKITYRQPDGIYVTVSIHGDEFSHWYETEDGKVLLHGSDGALCYAMLDASGRAVPSDVAATEVGERDARAADVALRQDRNALLKSIGVKGAEARKAAAAAKPGTISRSFSTEGVVNGLVILAEYQDVKFSEGHTRDVYDRLSNTPGYAGEHASCSVYDYFVAQSYGKFTPHFDVVGPVTLPHEMSYYGISELAPEMIIDACNEAKNTLGTDFSKYDVNNDGNVDFVFVIYAGYGESQGASYKTVWPQKVDLTYASWNTYDGLYLSAAACSCELRGNEGASLDGIGTFCHEFSHILGLPDVYDTGTGGTGFGMGCWDAMDRGIYLDDSRTPAGYTAMDKYSVGWIEPKILSEPARDVRLEPLSQAADAYFIVCESDADEYYTLENRQNTGCDKALPGHGLIISHVHYVPSLWSSNRVNASSNEYEHISLVAADNNKSTTTFDGDPFPGAANVTAFDGNTTPAMAWHTTDVPADCPITNIREENGVIIFDFKGNSTGVESVSLDSKVGIRAGKGRLEIDNPEGCVVTVSSVDGRKVSRSASLRQSVSLCRGIYVVSGNGRSEKIMIR